MKFTIRDLFLLMISVGLLCAWQIDRRAISARCSEARKEAFDWRIRADDLKSAWESLGGTVNWIDESTWEINDPDIDIDKNGRNVFRPYGSMEREQKEWETNERARRAEKNVPGNKKEVPGTD